MSDTQHTQGLELRATLSATSEDGDFSQDAYFGYLQGYRHSAAEIAALREALERIAHWTPDNGRSGFVEYKVVAMSMESIARRALGKE